VQGEAAASNTVSYTADALRLKSSDDVYLFIRNGMVDTLEGAATDGSTIGIDFSNVQFEII
jgi:hypothetical protein